MNRIKTDLCIIGGGSGGLSLAAGASQMGAKVVLLEGHKMGGDCLNYGCVPSKAMISAAHHAHAQTHSAAFGIANHTPDVDYAAVKDHVAFVIAAIAPHDSVERFEGFGVNVIEEYGEFISETEVKAGDTIIEARRFVISTGSSPFVPPIDGLDSVDYHTNETIFELRETPSRLIIVGGGPIGMEMAQAHQRLGVPVTVLEGDRVLAKDDPEITAIALENIRADGVEIEEGFKVTRVTSENGVTVEAEDGRKVTGSHLLMAVGRKANIDKLNLDAAGVKYDRAVKVDDSLRTSNKKVYAIGDVAGGLQFTHKAGYDATVVIKSILFGLPSKQRTDHIPWATYTDPEIAQIGLTEAQAKKKHGRDVEVLRFKFDQNDRAHAERRTEGLIKVMVYKGKPVGASVVGMRAGELIQPYALAIANGLKISALTNMVSPYPTMTEVTKRAAGQYYAPRLFESDRVKKIVGFVQKYLP
ncbi:dihydrolipoyl dehydrogenase family protein [Pontivivens insulae]|uniref:Mercuric reductase n=1 Tax=Pontivivens insulae TaxID=1639689 RepID=A0A2R8AFB0_9RHOB|nr:FAD-dependent oxidoreductase [Pontivivens insulae]RED12131.1 pyruvate/2-oxoglutarate dehydrogenase complex dihydrolipoamide dehydrogenase (E3) component [Pontivivens insulae]SPF30887.1 Mercuric reductase [Pontivivens insulae]